MFAKLTAPKGKKIQFLVTEPDGAWFVSDEGVKSGTYEGAASTITIEDEALKELVQGGATEAQLYQKGRMRVDGDVSAARDLSWLKEKN